VSKVGHGNVINHVDEMLLIFRTRKIQQIHNGDDEMSMSIVYAANHLLGDGHLTIM